MAIVPPLPSLRKICISVRFWRNWPPTPPQTQHFVLSRKLLSTLGYEEGRVLNIPSQAKGLASSTLDKDSQSHFTGCFYFSVNTLLSF